MERLAAINASLHIVPAQYQMTHFLAMAHGYKPAKPAEQKRAEPLHPGGALVYLFPDGVIRM